MPRAQGLSTRIFATAPYDSGEDGEVRAVLPARCPFAGPGPERCGLTVHHRRARSTGPCFPVDVVRCRTHPVCCFTLYPAGHVPYGRRAVLRCSVSGVPLLDPSVRALPLGGTVFEAAQTAADGQRWPPVGAGAEASVRRTQGRHIDVAGRLLGVHPDLGDGLRERIATRLEVSTMTLRTAARGWSASWTSRGAAIVAALAAVPQDVSLMDRLLSSAYAAELWPRPRRWDPPRRWVVARSTEPERTASDPPASRGQPSTNSHGAEASGLDPPSRSR